VPGSDSRSGCARRIGPGASRSGAVLSVRVSDSHDADCAPVFNLAGAGSQIARTGVRGVPLRPERGGPLAEGRTERIDPVEGGPIPLVSGLSWSGGDTAVNESVESGPAGAAVVRAYGPGAPMACLCGPHSGAI